MHPTGRPSNSFAALACALATCVIVAGCASRPTAASSPTAVPGNAKSFPTPQLGRVGRILFAEGMIKSMGANDMKGASVHLCQLDGGVCDIKVTVTLDTANPVCSIDSFSLERLVYVAGTSVTRWTLQSGNSDFVVEFAPKGVVLADNTNVDATMKPVWIHGSLIGPTVVKTVHPDNKRFKASAYSIFAKYRRANASQETPFTECPEFDPVVMNEGS